MEAPPHARYLLFLKAPRPGLVKTRLAAALGEEEACRVYRRLVDRLLAGLPEGFPLELHFSPADGESEMREWLGDRFPLVPQIVSGLGERLEYAVGRAFRRGAEQVFCIGGDCPGLGMGQLRAASERLSAGADLALGPCEDGGYYLIGMRRFYPELFRGIPWSSSETLRATLDRAKPLGLEVARLETLFDVDTIEDWRRLCEAEAARQRESGSK